MTKKNGIVKQGSCVIKDTESEFIYVDEKTTEKELVKFTKCTKVIKTKKGFIVYWEDEPEVSFMPFNTYNVKFSKNTDFTMDYDEQQFNDKFKVVE